MTRYLLDRDVMSQLDQPEEHRHENVRAWLRPIPDNRLCVSAVTIMEGWKGLAIMRRRSSPDAGRLRDCDRYDAAFARLVAALSDRILPIDEAVATVWGRLLGDSDKNRIDACVAATAIVHDLVVATRNTADFHGRGARVVDPFHKRPTVRAPEADRSGR